MSASPRTDPLRIDHVGIAVRDLEAAATRYRMLLGVPPGYRERVVADGVDVVVFVLGSTRVELMAPFAPGSVQKFIDQRGEALHHLAYAVADLPAALARAEAAGAELIDRAPRPGAAGKLVAFIHPKSAHGVLTELVQVHDG